METTEASKHNEAGSGLHCSSFSVFFFGKEKEQKLNQKTGQSERERVSEREIFCAMHQLH